MKSPPPRIGATAPAGAAVATPANACRDQDLARGWTWCLLWGVPIVLIVAGEYWTGARAWLWTPALAVMGAACLVNVRRCGRRHCYFSGPVFLLGALASLLNGLGLATLAWNGILLAVVIGAAIACGVECAQGPYARTG